MHMIEMIMLCVERRNPNSITRTLERYIIPMRMSTLEVIRTNIDMIFMKMTGTILENLLSAPYITSIKNMSKVMNTMSSDTAESITAQDMKSFSTSLTTTGSNSTPTNCH